MAHIEARIMYFLTVIKRKLLSSLNTSFLSVKVCKQLISALVLSLSENIFIFTPPNVLPCISTSRLDRKLLQILLEVEIQPDRMGPNWIIYIKYFCYKIAQMRQVISPRIRFFDVIQCAPRLVLETFGWRLWCGRRHQDVMKTLFVLNSSRMWGLHDIIVYYQPIRIQESISACLLLLHVGNNFSPIWLP